MAYSEISLRELEQIADWTENRFGRAQSERYLTFLQSRIKKLGGDYSKGRRVVARDDLQYVRLNWRLRSYGHIIVYSVNGTEVRIAHILYSAQDWEKHLEQ